MTTEKFQFDYELYDSIDELPGQDNELLDRARKTTVHAYAPYSHFHVGAAARLANGEIVTGTNQENASYPVGICAERVLLSSVSSLFPDQAVEAIAVSYDSKEIVSDHPVAPCGVCRQSLQEYQARFNASIRVIMGGMKGKVIVLPSADHLLPFGFTATELG